MKKLFLAGVAALLLATRAAHAQEGWSVGTWDCPSVRIELRKYAVHDYKFSVSGQFQVNPLRVNVKQLSNGTISFNGKRCRPVEDKEEEAK
jgi:hypothetical protein